VLVCQERLSRSRPRAVIVNSGCANACTGEGGMADAREMAALAGRKLDIAAEEVLVASTGVIGMPLPMDRVRLAVGSMALSGEGGHAFARAIMTTDTFPKEVALTFDIRGARVTVGAAAKGAGMIHPNMATLLCFVTTDAAIDDRLAASMLKQAVDVSFNMISIDGDTSTNDTVLFFANGLAGNEPLQANTPEAEIFQTALIEVCTHLAKCVARDGEGATRLVEVKVDGASSDAEARLAARAVVKSPLVKAAIHGADPNWGRIVAAAGRSGANVDQSKIDLRLGDNVVLKAGLPVHFDVEAVRRVLSAEEVPISIHLNLGSGTATAWGCDLSEEYVTINSAYST
jgi:glutamate N-acetyltransferase/amino-acid N-acetyltransferase